MARIIVIQHSDIGTPGRLGLTLRDHGFRLDVRRPDRDGPGAIPETLDDVAGVLSLGGPQNLDEGHEFIAREMVLLRAAHEHELVVLGICLGCQLVAAALGGTVSRMPGGPEVGFHDVSLTIPGQTEPVLAGVPWTSAQFCSHAYEVSKAPEGATVLASSQACKVQAFRAGLRTFAFQYHFECDREQIDATLRGECALAARAGLDEAALARQADSAYARFAVVADRLSVNLVSYAFPTLALLSA